METKLQIILRILLELSEQILYSVLEGTPCSVFLRTSKVSKNVEIFF